MKRRDLPKKPPSARKAVDVPDPVREVAERHAEVMVDRLLKDPRGRAHLARDVDLSTFEPGDPELIRFLAKADLAMGRITYRQDARGVYHVRLPGDEPEVAVPPHDFPRGPTPRAVLLECIRRRRLPVSAETLALCEDTPLGNYRLHTLMALAMLGAADEGCSADDAAVAYFLGYKDEDTAGFPSDDDPPA